LGAAEEQGGDIGGQRAACRRFALYVMQCMRAIFCVSNLNMQ
jgi:hypothetical protein